ncbi:MarR family winged helix-turn-helix transcriptional regulator [Cedecea neteri]|uniref:MarR family winged helix-turn-helix transcriptional regulator n=1 Tax=Cedecea neteri TaxID=158822 RepID=UPI002AA6CE42|nr:MarR family winged helix-turn-helix transcriptional regulator [Cedecea neteri]WPU20962.1 MarR family winged helix-turn-helix transcriptional regulator [Cedecea neteri]
MSSQPESPQLGLLLRQVHQHWTQQVDLALSNAGFDDIRPSHSSVFAFTPPEGITVSALTKFAQVRKQSMSQAVAELEKLGYVERRPDPTDRRARRVFLTAKGEGVRPVALAAGSEVQKEWANAVGNEDIRQLTQLLQKLASTLQG